MFVFQVVTTALLALLIVSVESILPMNSFRQSKPTTTTTQNSNEITSTIDNLDETTITESQTEGAKKIKESTVGWWMTSVGELDEELLQIQAIIVKDESAVKNCVPGNRRSEKRYFMCAGSILSKSLVLTSASCIHHATHIRHNVRAPLAVIVGPMKTELQIIRVIDYKIHPQHVPDPYNEEHAMHNVAILKLGCRISLPNLHEVRIPAVPFTELCEDSCKLAVIRKATKTSVIIYETQAKDMPLSKKKRRSVTPETMARRYRKIADPPIFESIVSSYHQNQTLESEEAVTETNPSSESGYVPTNPRFLHDLHSLFTSTLSSSEKEEAIKLINADVYDTDASLEQESSNKVFSVRSSSGTNGCPVTGTPVMLGTDQVAVVAVPCDDRQPETRWRYTDISANAEWIKGVMSNWDYIMEPPVDKDHHGGGCHTCIYNFFIGYKGKNSSRNGLSKESDTQHLKTMDPNLCKKGPVTRTADAMPQGNKMRPNVNSLPVTKDDVREKEFKFNNRNFLNNQLPKKWQITSNSQSKDNAQNCQNNPQQVSTNLNTRERFDNKIKPPSKINFRINVNDKNVRINNNIIASSTNITRNNIPRGENEGLADLYAPESPEILNEDEESLESALNRESYDNLVDSRYVGLSNNIYSSEKKTQHSRRLIPHHL